MHRWKISLTLIAASSLAVTSVFAAVFPDVPTGHIFQDPIEQLASAGVINGNPDGNFYPDRDVNRAEMLKMLYLAQGKQPDATSVRCFPDVLPGSWYESFVCDASAMRYVAGYSDGSFKPSQNVNRVEAIKMIQEVFEIPVPEINAIDQSIVNFVDVSASAWYTRYLVNAYMIGILPIAGQDASRFYPDRPLSRGEAAAMIYNGQRAEIQLQRQQTEEDLGDDDDDDTQQSSSADTEQTESSDGTTQDGGQDDVTTPTSLSVDFPLDQHGKFSGKETYSFLFSLSQSITVSTIASLQSGQPGTIRCTLYLLKSDGFSEQYYLGTQNGATCELLTTLTPGDYQLQLQPTDPNTTFTVVAHEAVGDGNDGFSEAQLLPLNTAKTATISPNNFMNWYKFSNTSNDPKRLKVEMSNMTNMSCIVYSMSDVDLFGFSMPQCNQYYQYPQGTYYIAITRGISKSASQTYTVLLRE